MNIVDIAVKDIRPYENNARNNKKAIDKVKKSIEEFGFKVPIVLDKNYIIVCGHTRYEAAIKLGMDKVPCIVASDLDDKKIKAYRLADNKVSEFSTWDVDMLMEELEDIRDFDMSDFGFEFSNDKEKSNKPKGSDLSEKVKEVFEVIVECSDESDQEELYDRLISEGLTCRVLTL